MNKQRIAGILTVLILAVVLGATLTRKNGWTWRTILAARQVAATPEDSIFAMLDAARKGDIKKYLAAYGGSMEASLRQTIAESSDAAFRQYLVDANAAVKGIAVQAPESVNDREVKVRVEYVYQDRNEVQTMYLDKSTGVWKITRVEGAERVKTLIPYGTPVR